MEKKLVQYEDIYEFSTLSGAKISPDGRFVVFAESRCDKDSNGYKSKLWLYDGEKQSVRLLTNSGSDRGAFFERDTGAVIFTSRRTPPKKDAKPEDVKTQFYRIFPDGGEAELYFEIPAAAGAVTQITDNLYLVRATQNALPEEERPKRKGYQVFDEIPFWLNGQGFSNKKRPALGLYSRKEGSFKRITTPMFECGDANLSPDRSKIVFSGSELIGAKRRRGGLYLYDIAGDKTTELINPDSMCVDRANFFDDNTIFFMSNPCKDSHSNSLMYRYIISENRYERIGEENDLALMGMLRGSDGLLYASYDNWSTGRIVAIDRDGHVVKSFDAPCSVQSFDVRDGKIAFTGDSPDGMQELYTVENGAAVRRSSINDSYVESHEIAHADRFVFTNSDGIEIEGWIMRPIGFEKGKKYPGLLEIHGGPKAVYTSAYFHEMQAYAAMGYYVFFCNPRGSNGRGSDFADITGKLGGIDYNDIMEFTDEVIKREPELDENRMGVLGGSYGGFMTNWVIGHTDRFKAAASQRSISNYFTKCLTTDIGHYHNLTQMETDPWAGSDVFWDHSPLKYANNAKTPTVFIHSDHDFRCWMSEGIQMYNALKQNGVDAKICLFKDENHELSRSGKPENRISRLKEMGDWFETYLK